MVQACCSLKLASGSSRSNSILAFFTCTVFYCLCIVIEEFKDSMGKMFETKGLNKVTVMMKKEREGSLSVLIK